MVWCVAGEALMDWYLRPNDDRDPEQRHQELRAQWSELARYILQYRRPTPKSHYYFVRVLLLLLVFPSN